MAWEPQKIFYSHASADKTLTSIFKRLIEEEKILQHECKLYVADHTLNGGHITETFRSEMYNSNALVVAWTKSARKKATSQIISYEIGMAYSLKLPVFIFIFDGLETPSRFFGKLKIPWFFGEITKYERVSSQSEEEIRKALKKIDINSFINPITVNFPREKYIKYNGENQSKNLEVIKKDGSIELKKKWNDIIHYKIINHRPKTETNVRIKIIFPEGIDTECDFGEEYQFRMNDTQRTEVFVPIKYSNGLMLYFPAIAAEDIIISEICVKTKNKEMNDFVKISITSDNITRWRSTKIPLKVTD